MKIEKISPYNNIINTNNKINFTNFRLKPLPEDSFEFSRSKDKEINKFLSAAKKEFKYAQKQSKVFSNELEKLIVLGSPDNYSQKIEYKNKNVNFANISEEFEIPHNINIWQDGKLYRSYDIDSMYPLFIAKIYDCSDDKVEKECMILEGRLLSYSEKNISDNFEKAIMISRDGFYYYEGHGGIDAKELTFSKDGDNKYSEIRDGISTSYDYDPNKRIWYRK